MLKRQISRLVHYLLLIAIALYLVSGLGITYYRTMEKLTLGLLTKPLSFTLHNYLLIPFLILLVLHLGLAIKRRRK